MPISDIDPLTPTGQDLVLNGDDEIQALKQDIVDSFEGVDGGVYEDADTAGTGGTVFASAATMSSWEARIKAIEATLVSPEGTSVPLGAVMMWDTVANGIPPTGWAYCDGTVYEVTIPGDPDPTIVNITTRDMRGRFPVGAGISISGTPLTAGLSGGVPFNALDFDAKPAVTVTTGKAGAHTHTVSTPGRALTEANLPQHAHGMFANSDGTLLLEDFTFDTVTLKNLTNGNENQRYNISRSDGQVANAGITGMGNGTSTLHTHPDTITGEELEHDHLGFTTPPYMGCDFICYIANGTPV